MAHTQRVLCFFLALFVHYTGTCPSNLTLAVQLPIYWVTSPGSLHIAQIYCSQDHVSKHQGSLYEPQIVELLLYT